MARRILPAPAAQAGRAAENAARPDGPLVWLHGGTGSRPAAILELGKRLAAALPKVSVLLTSADPQAPDPTPPLLGTATPGDSAGEVRAFLDRWSPAAAVFTGGVAYPNALLDLGAAGVPVCLADASLPATALRTFRWTPGMRRAVFSHVGAVLTQRLEDAETFEKLGLPADRIEVVGALEEGAPPLPANEAELSDLAGAFAGRPTWLAAGATEAEEDAVIGAHQRALQLSHRLLLVLVPSDPERGPMLSARLEEQGWRVALRSEGDEPAGDCQIYIADTEGEDGLWYRLCPVTFLGGTLVPDGGPGRDPCGPATLGSAILGGPASTSYRWRLVRFLAAGGARTVTSGEALGDELADLLAPDKAAEMARRAWEVTSDGAEATDRVIGFVRKALDPKARG
jgi:3-deoxy-D-manno-octulosonic-acid transferase